MRIDTCLRVTNCARSSNNWISTRRHFEPRRCYHQVERNVRSSFWAPSSKSQGGKKTKGEREDPNVLLGRAGFARQAYSGIFHLLPLGLRVQTKIERLLDKHMHDLRASRVSLSSISSQNLWSKSGRLSKIEDAFTFQDRRDARWLLSPTHEEEITELVHSKVESYRDLPVRLYQISRKYRDEPRPRQGLLRSREFVMKDLYTFDADVPSALHSYSDVRAAYDRFFAELKLPYIVAKADSGSIGGDLNHEYHLPSPKGEDTILSCSHCSLVRNEEVIDRKQVEVRPLASVEVTDARSVDGKTTLRETMFVTEDRRTLVKVFCYNDQLSGVDETPRHQINPHAVKATLPQVALGIENPSEQFISAHPDGSSIIYMFDDQITDSDIHASLSAAKELGDSGKTTRYLVESATGCRGIPDLVKPRSGDECTACSQGQIKVQKSIEIGHTFHLGTRYSAALDAKIAVDPASRSTHEALMQMGCHGIGVSRLIAAAASILSDEVGLNWPRLITPFEVIVIPHSADDTDSCFAVYDQILQGDGDGDRACNDAIVDDRATDWLTKLRDADLVGYPVIIFLGRKWKTSGQYEVQCRRLKVKQDVSGAELTEFVRGLLEQI
jgi:prolyl-tRNA synthetase